MKKFIIITIVLILLVSLAVGISQMVQNPEAYDTNINSIMRNCNVSQEQASEIWAILKECGIEKINSIKRDELLDGAYAETDIGYRINGTEPVLYLTDTGTVHLVRYAGKTLYDSEK